MKPKLLYLTFKGLENDSGYGIQVLSEIEQLVKRGYPIIVMTFPAYRSWNKLSQRFADLKSRFSNYDVEWVLPRVTGEYRNIFRLLLNPYIERIIRSTIRKFQIDIIHAHGFDAGLFASHVVTKLPVKFVLDLHGVYFWEKANERGRVALDKHDLTVKRYQKQVMLNRADKVFVVSEYFKRYLHDTYFLPPDKIEITPSGTVVKDFVSKEQRDQLRREHGFNDKFLMVYAGSVHRWQKIQEVIKLAVALRKVIPNFNLLVLTRAVETVETLLYEAQYPIESAFIKSVPHSEMHKWLSMADVGVLLRDANLVNRVASPVKFAEYLAAGLSIICSKGIGDSENVIQKTGAGYLVDEITDGSIEALATSIADHMPDDANRIKLHKAALQIYDWEQIIPTFNRVYAELVGTSE